jgi:spectinomycin phosphotransferase
VDGLVVLPAVGAENLWVQLTGCDTVIAGVDTPPPTTLDDKDLVAALNVAWALRAREARYHPKGAGSYHWAAETDSRSKYFITVDDLDSKPWISPNRDSTFDGLGAAYETAWVLRHEAGIASVVGPVRRPDGSVLLRLSDQYSMAVFPFVDGDAGSWGDPLTEQARAPLLRELARLHKATPLAGGRISRRPLDLPERPLLTAALDALDRPWDGGPFSEPARHALADRAQEVTGRLAHMDVLGGRLEAGEGEPVLTHGEPHPGNLISTNDGLGLIDWDTVALASPERDLWMLDDGTPDALALYEESTGTRTSETAIAFYRLAWTLSDIASFVHMFRSPHPQTGWVEQKWATFQRLVAGAPSRPYGGH